MTGRIVRPHVRVAVFPAHLAAPILISDVYASGHSENAKFNLGANVARGKLDRSRYVIDGFSA